MRAFLKALLVLLVGLGVIIGAVMFFVVTSRGISAREEPGRMETLIAGTMRSLAIPRGERNRKNPIAVSEEVIASGMSHWADHCAACHANDGSGDTEIGVGLYPKPPDMRRSPTQSLSDGELFYIIENGIRLTGMPAWGTGTAEGEEGTWHLVHFIRRLPSLTPEEIERMQTMNPRSADELKEEGEMQRFLEGGEKPSAPAPPSHKHGGR